LYIIGTVTGVLSVALTNAILEAPASLAGIAGSQNQVILGTLFVLAMGLALAMVPVVMYPISSRYNKTLAMGYVVFRGALETVTYLAVVLSTLLLVTLAREFMAADAPAGSFFQPLGALLLSASEWLAQITTCVFILGALMFYYVLYRYRLVPRWISGWGLIATLPYLAAGLLALFGAIGHMSTVDTILRVPLGLQEMVLAVWLIVRGFHSPQQDVGRGS
jgi:hypothetical protein